MASIPVKPGEQTAPIRRVANGRFTSTLRNAYERVPSTRREEYG